MALAKCVPRKRGAGQAGPARQEPQRTPNLGLLVSCPGELRRMWSPEEVQVITLRMLWPPGEGSVPLCLQNSWYILGADNETHS